MIIDIHTHAWPEKVSGKARESLESSFRVRLVGDPTLKILLSFMDKNSIDISAVAAVATKPDQVTSINDWLFSIRGKRIRVFCAMHPDFLSWEKELKRIKESGDGIKFQGEFQDFYVDENRMFPLYETIQRLELPILFHCGKELSGTMLVRSSPSRLAKILKNFPHLKVIAGHFGGFELWDEVKKYLLGKDVYLDTSFFFDYLPKKEVRSLILAHRPDRLLFGTDFPLIDQKKDLDFLNSLDLPEDLRQHILYLNAQNLLGIS
ncbi:MAG: amidohydrolase family protein [Candidatus Omnitrophica bacterium]|nr:amidohydrolase family protein [Candidatus Omnitrophota bacterium]HOX55063.1 amidohydrolase family protein [Candidatus Omnitrophota bacterium]